MKDSVLSTITTTVQTSPATLRPSASESRRGPAGRSTLAPELEKGKVGRGLRRLVTASSPDIPARVRAQSADFCGGGNHVPWSLDLPTDRNWKWQRNLLVPELLPGRVLQSHNVVPQSIEDVLADPRRSGVYRTDASADDLAAAGASHGFRFFSYTWGPDSDRSRPVPVV